jgi:4-alpha-glucanotransferase
MWGVFAPMYALRGARDFGAGDLAAMGELTQWVGELGGAVVGTLPLLAAFYEEEIFQPSPYSPATRKFWNELYLDLPQLVAMVGDHEATRLLGSSAVTQGAASLSKLPYVDYASVWALKRTVLSAASKAAWASDELRGSIESFAASQPDLERYAAFRAATDRARRPWTEWSCPMRDGVLTADDYDEDERRYHLFVQWALDRQLSRLVEPGRAGLYLDLPVGVNATSYDVWADRNAFASGVSVGAPPDGLFEGGQQWGLPPLHPERSRANGHAYFAACVRAHAQRASVLRVDHVMGLHRLYCVPEGFAATEGLYVNYAAEELYAALVLESTRNECAIVGEDLGTVPEAVRPAMERHGIHRLFVAQFAGWSEDGQGGESAPVNSVASLDTHDTATIGAVAEAEWPDADPMALLETWTDRLAGSEARGVLVTLEDLWLELEPQNRPGTALESPNWRHRIDRTVAELSGDPALNRALNRVDEKRKTST